MASWRTRTSTGIRPQYSSRSACSAVTACPRTAQRQPGKSSICKPESKRKWLKKETHAARWGLLRGYSSKATKWVDFVMTDSTRRESCHSLKVTAKLAVSSATLRAKWWPRNRLGDLPFSFGNLLQHHLGIQVPRAAGDVDRAQHQRFAQGQERRSFQGALPNDRIL